MNGMTIEMALADEATAMGIARVQVAAWQVAYRGLLPEALLAGLTVEGRAQLWRELLGSTTRGAFTLLLRGGDGSGDADADEVVGFCDFGQLRDAGTAAGEGEIYAIYLLPGRWRQGGGSALMTAALTRLREAGFSAVSCWVLSTNDAALRFYARHGFDRVLDGSGVKSERIGEVVKVSLKFEV